MKKTMKVGLLLIAAAGAWRLHGRHHDEPKQVATVVASAQPEAPHRTPAPVIWRHAAPMQGVELRERAPLDELPAELAELTTAELEEQIDTLRGDADSYYELSDDARVQYDALEAARLVRLGVPELAEQRLAPYHEVLTLDGEEVSP